MNIQQEVAFETVSLQQKSRPNGPVTTARIQRFNIGYFLLCLLGALPAVLEWSSSWQAFGWGLWFPGAGFIALGGWSIGATLVTFVLFALAFIAWFGSGMIIAPVIVWLGAAIVAGLAAGGQPEPQAQWLIPAFTAALVFGMMYTSRRNFENQLAKAACRVQAMPQAYAEMRSAQTQDTSSLRHELNDKQLGSLRWLLDRALQPVGELNGFIRIDQFQTAALRYQLNFVGYALGMCQRHYTPNFHGYMSAGQRRVIEQYLEPAVCGYWRLENAWGNLSLNADPAQKDNIMLTGYFNTQVCLYMNTTGDRRYCEPGSLTFKVTDKLRFPHDVHSINQSLVDNFQRSNEQYCLYPCEPNWIYPACNMYGMNALTAYDATFGTDQVASLRSSFRHKMESEFINPAGGVVPLRSKLTGHALPFPAPDAANVLLLSPIYPDLAARYWTYARHENIVEESGVKTVKHGLPPIDFGSYSKNDLFMLESILAAAVEFGDEAAVEVVQGEIDRLCTEINEGGRRYYQASTLANASYARTAFGFKDAWRDAIAKPMPESGLKGPLLAEVNFPETLVARAVSNGDDLELVLVGSKDGNQHKLEFARLQPGQLYSLSGEGLNKTLTACENGTASIDIATSGRQEIHLEPLV